MKEIESPDYKINKGVKGNAFDAVCSKNNIEHRLRLPYYPRTNGQVERMTRTSKEAKLKQYYYKTHDKLKDHLQSFIDANNFSNGLKALKDLTVFGYINKSWNEEPDKFRTNRMRLFAGVSN